ncbi:MAG: hypothetical protein ACR5K9_07735 [Wolbachia sp.]
MSLYDDVMKVAPPPVIPVLDTGIQENLLVHKQIDSVIIESS